MNRIQNRCIWQVGQQILVFEQMLERRLEDHIVVVDGVFRTTRVIGPWSMLKAWMVTTEAAAMKTARMTFARIARSTNCWKNIIPPNGQPKEFRRPTSTTNRPRRTWTQQHLVLHVAAIEQCELSAYPMCPASFTWVRQERRLVSPLLLFTARRSKLRKAFVLR